MTKIIQFLLPIVVLTLVIVFAPTNGMNFLKKAKKAIGLSKESSSDYYERDGQYYEFSKEGEAKAKKKMKKKAEKQMKEYRRMHGEATSYANVNQIPPQEYEQQASDNEEEAAHSCKSINI